MTSLLQQLDALSDDGSGASEPDAVPEGCSYVTGLRATVAEMLGEAVDSPPGGPSRPLVPEGAAVYQEEEEEEEAVDEEANLSGAEEDDDPDAHRKAPQALSPADADYLQNNAPLPDAHADAPNLDTDVACPDPDAVYADSDTSYPDTDARYPDKGAAFPDTGEAYPDSDPMRPRPVYTGVGAPYAAEGGMYPDRGSGYMRGAVPHPNLDAGYPNTDAAYPNTDAAYPNTDAAYPNTDAAYPMDAGFAVLEAGYPDTDAPYPSNDAAYPDADAAFPGRGVCYPGMDGAFPPGRGGYSGGDAGYLDAGVGRGGYPPPVAYEVAAPAAAAPRKPAVEAGPAFGMGDRVLYLEGTGGWVPAVVTDVDQMAEALGGERAYTVRLASGAERATVGSRLRPMTEQKSRAQAARKSAAKRPQAPVTRDAVAAASARWSTSGSAVILPRLAPGAGAVPGVAAGAGPGSAASSKPSSPGQFSPPPGQGQLPAWPQPSTAGSLPHAPPPAPPAAQGAPPAARPPAAQPPAALPASPPPAPAASGYGAAPPSASRPRWRPPDWVKPAVLHQPVLEMIERGAVSRSLPVGSRGVWVLGRHGGVADIQLDDPSISRAQAAILNSSSATFLADLDSAHGTWYDPDGRSIPVPQLGQRLGSEPIQLQEGATFRLGSSKAVYRVRGVHAEQLERWTPPPWAEPPQRKCFLQVRSNDLSNPYLVHLQDQEGDCEEELPLLIQCTVMGRKADLCDIVLTDGSVSRQHAVILHAEAGGRPESFVLDLGSASGTFVNAQRIAPNKPFRLSDGDAISLGECKATYTFRVGHPGARRPAGARETGGPKKRARAP
jgi:integrin beta 8